VASSADAPQIVVLDTNVWSCLFGNSRSASPEQVGAWRSHLAGRVPVIATQTRAEVLIGLSALGSRRRKPIAAALDAAHTAPVSDAVVGAYAALAAAAKTQGHPIHQKIHAGDRWIAATAIAFDAPLLTADGMFIGAPDLVLAEAVPAGAPRGGPDDPPQGGSGSALGFR
jgi:predicted nucleic acid-binding protein